jgi:DNA repair protein RecN (Recombination protein N)
MLHALQIRNFAIIDELELHFAPGLNILTGETGAGKSIIIDAVGLLLGDRAATEWVRAGSEVASIEATFSLPPSDSSPSSTAAETDHQSEDEEHPAMLDVRALLEREGLDDPDQPEYVTLAREVRLNGRNLCRINGRSVPLQLLADVAGALIDIHGQGEHLNLLQARNHIHLLDRYAGLLPQRAEFAEVSRKLRTVRSELQRLRNDARTVAQRIDLLSFQVEEIGAARFVAGEEEELEGERRRLGNAEALLKLAQGAEASLSAGDGEAPSALDLLGQTVDRMERLARIDSDFQTHADEAQALLEQLGDIARVIEDYAESLEFNPARLADVEERLELLANLRRKYGDTIAQINEYGAKASQELEQLLNWEGRTADLEAQEEKLLHRLGKMGDALSLQRQSAGETLARAVEKELADLRMERARFGVSVSQQERTDGAYLADGRRVAFDATGIDRVEFLLSANPGEPLKPMAKVASGGETARLMLALKGVLAHADATPTLIFDEIDQGIGGRVGAIVGQKLWMLTATTAHANGNGVVAPANSHQVLCITHLPQLAAFGDAHYTVNKAVTMQEGEERTRTVVRTLDTESRIQELTQMLGATSESGRASVVEMLGNVAKVKNGA